MQGAVTFQRAVLRYRPSLPCALNGVSFETKPAEKIGIVGRTGSGKSSLFVALFRIGELEAGQILIDGINVSHLPLQDLRLVGREYNNNDNDICRPYKLYHFTHLSRLRIYVMQAYDVGYMQYNTNMQVHNTSIA